MIGSPSVFHTAPPHPASNARITCSPQFAGGPDASQKGFGQRIPPANTVVRSAMLRLQPTHHSQPRAFSLGHRINHFATAVHAIAAGVVARIRRTPRRWIYHHSSIANLDPPASGEK